MDCIQLAATITTFVAVAIILTAFRLHYRWRIRRFWWDDAWAGISMLFEFILITAFWIRTDVPGLCIILRFGT
jgi:uncharacterized membrane protein